MKAVLIGSRAAKHWFPNFPREPKDIDLITKESVPGAECHYYPAFDWLLEQGDIASANALYTIKLSHCFWNIHWSKTMFDIEFFANNGCSIIEPLYSDLYDTWTQVHGAKKAYLDVENEAFFNSNIERKFNHDDLHEAIKYGDRPYFKKLKTDQSKALISKKLFDELSYEEKLKACREEAYVIALERFIIPQKTNNRQIAYRRALKLLITSMTKGWFPRFIVDNWSEMKQLDKHPFVELFERKLS